MPVGADGVGGLLEVALHDAEIDGVPGALLGCLGAHRATVGAQRDEEVLVVHGSGGELGGFHGGGKPCRCGVAFHDAELLDRLRLARRSLRLAVSHGDADAQLLARGHACARFLAGDEGDPAGVESESLRGEDDALPPVSDGFVLRVAVGDERDVNGRTSYEAEARNELKRLGVVGDDLNVEPAFARALVDDGLQRRKRIGIDGLVAIFAHRVPRANNIENRRFGACRHEGSLFLFSRGGA